MSRARSSLRKLEREKQQEKILAQLVTVAAHYLSPVRGGYSVAHFPDRQFPTTCDRHPVRRLSRASFYLYSTRVRNHGCLYRGDS